MGERTNEELLQFGQLVGFGIVARVFSVVNVLN